MQLLLTALACALRRPHVTVAGAAVEVPLVHPSTDRTRGYVMAEVAGLGRGLFLVDTGYAFSACDDALVAGLEAPLVGSAVQRGVLGSVRADVAALPTLHIGAHRVDGLRCTVRDLGTTSSVRDPPEVPVFGVLGMDVWGAFAVDVSRGAWTVRGSDGSAGSAPNRLRGEARRGDRARLDVHLGGVRRRLVLDTGSNVTLIRGLPLPSTEVGVRLAGSGGDGTLRTTRQWAVPAVVAGVPLASVRALEVDAPPVVGMDVLGAADWTWDFPARRYDVRIPRAAGPVDDTRVLVHLGGS